jgi:hypothetical protein
MPVREAQTRAKVYRERAAQLRRLAAAAPLTNHGWRMLKLAEKFEDLAADIEEKAEA